MDRATYGSVTGATVPSDVASHRWSSVSTRRKESPESVQGATELSAHNTRRGSPPSTSSQVFAVPCVRVIRCRPGGAQVPPGAGHRPDPETALVGFGFEGEGPTPARGVHHRRFDELGGAHVDEPVVVPVQLDPGGPGHPQRSVGAFAGIEDQVDGDGERAVGPHPEGLHPLGRPVLELAARPGGSSLLRPGGTQATSPAAASVAPPARSPRRRIRMRVSLPPTGSAGTRTGSDNPLLTLAK